MKNIKTTTNILSLLLFIIFIIIAITGNGKTAQNVKIISIDTDAKIVDDWKTPGRYAPVNVFDDDPSTCFAGGREAKRSSDVYLTLEIQFEKTVFIDEIQILSGFAKDEKSYDENSRVKKLWLYIYPLSRNSEKDKIEKQFILEDKMEFQTLNLGESYNVKSINFFASNIKTNPDYEVYPGSKYDVLCVSEIAFYNKGEKINVEKLNLLKKNYIKSLNARLVNLLSDKVFSYGGSDMNSLTSYKDGRLKFFSKEGNTPANYPDAWKVKNAKLYLRKKGKWILFEYMFFQGKNIKIYDPNSEGILERWDYYEELK